MSTRFLKHLKLSDMHELSDFDMLTRIRLDRYTPLSLNASILIRLIKVRNVCVCVIVF